MFILMVNGRDAIPFIETKTYEVGTGYIALYEKNKCCILCRYLKEDEKEMFSKLHYLYDCTKEPLTNESAGRIGRPVMILTDKAESFETADIIVENFKKALDTLPLVTS